MPKRPIKLEGIRFTLDDGGRKAAGFKGKKVNDCVCRAIAIATEQPYRVVYDALSSFGWAPVWYAGQPQAFVTNERIREYLAGLGWGWTPTGRRTGISCNVHMQADELPTGRVIVSTVGFYPHLVAVIDGVIHDDAMGRRDGGWCMFGCPLGPQCVSGYFAREKMRYLWSLIFLHSVTAYAVPPPSFVLSTKLDRANEDQVREAIYVSPETQVDYPRR